MSGWILDQLLTRISVFSPEYASLATLRVCFDILGCVLDQFAPGSTLLSILIAIR
jgi:hypothetical protein